MGGACLFATKNLKQHLSCCQLQEFGFWFRLSKRDCQSAQVGQMGKGKGGKEQDALSAGGRNAAAAQHILIIYLDCSFIKCL